MRVVSKSVLLYTVAIIISVAVAGERISSSTPWQTLTGADGSSATARHEASATAVSGKLYLLGGRSRRPVDIYDTATGRWRSVNNVPMEIHHFQAVAVDQKIYLVGAFTCCYPNEESVADIHVFDIASETWSIAGQVPSNRLRGGAAAVVWDGGIYLVGGNTKGHNGGAVGWFDRYDLATGDWTTLPDAPHARDHFAAAVVSGQLVAAGGRATTQPNPFENTIAPTDVYDFAAGEWRTVASIPTPRAGMLVTGAGNEVLVAGGESNAQRPAFNTVESLDVTTGEWRTLQPLKVGRHSGGAALIGSVWHVVAGNKVKGGGSETSSHETLELGVSSDQDGDGLSDIDEVAIYNSDPSDSDTDDDGATDGQEAQAGSNLRKKDTDEDGLSDGDELNRHDSSPVLKDTDDDGVDDYDEVNEWQSNPSSADSDSDGLDDRDEIDRGTSPVNPDSDSDTLNDGAEITAGTNPLKADTDDDGLNDAEDPEPLIAQKTVDPQTPSTGETSSTKKSGGAVLGIIFLIFAVILARKRRVISKISRN